MKKARDEQPSKNLRRLKPSAALIEAVNPSRLAYAPEMCAILGAIFGHDYGARTEIGTIVTNVWVTDDGTLLGKESGGQTIYLGSAAEFDHDLKMLLDDAALMPEERAEFDAIYEANFARSVAPADTPKCDTPPHEEPETVSQESWKGTLALLLDALENSPTNREMPSRNERGATETTGEQESTALTPELARKLGRIIAAVEAMAPPDQRPKTPEEKKAFALRVLAELENAPPEILAGLALPESNE